MENFISGIDWKSAAILLATVMLAYKFLPGIIASLRSMEYGLVLLAVILIAAIAVLSAVPPFDRYFVFLNNLWPTIRRVFGIGFQ